MRDYLSALGREGEVRLVKREVDPRHELAAVIQASQEESEAALLFERVRGSSLPVAANLDGSRRRLCRIIGADDGNFCRRWVELTSALDDVAATQPGDAGPLVSGGIAELPLITYYERDAGPYFTSAVFLAREPESGAANLSFHRAQVMSDQELRVRLGPSHDLAKYQAQAEARGEALEAAMLIGAPPEVFLAAAASLPINADEMQAAAAIAGSPIAVRPCNTVDLEVPVASEIVIEGRILPGLCRPEGPFGEFMGYYVPVADNAVFEVSQVSWREGATFQALLCSSADDYRLLETAIAARIYRHLTETAKLPGIVDVSCQPTLLNTVVQIDKQSHDHPREVLLAAFDAHPDYSKMCVVVDRDVDPYNMSQAMWAYLTRGRADTRAFIIEDVPGFYRDDNRDHWGRLAIDATKPWGREAEFERTHIPGVERVRLSDYLSG